jgi:Protein of unknown function (DUF1616)
MKLLRKASYAKTTGSMRAPLSGNRDLVIVVGLALACAMVIEQVALPPARIAAGLFLALILPGYAVTSLVFPRQRLDHFETLLCTCGFGLVIAALGGLLLDLLPGSIQRAEWVALLLATTVAAAVAARRPESVPGADEEEHSDRVTDANHGQLLRATNLILGLLAIALATFAVLVARDSANHAAAFSELSSVPVASVGGDRLDLRVGSHEHSRLIYELTISGLKKNMMRFPITLNPGEEWHHLTRLPRITKRVLITLYKGDETKPYLQTSYYPAPSEPDSQARG